MSQLQSLRGMVDLLPEQNRRWQAVEAVATAANTAALEAWVGFKPSTPIETGVQRFADWYRSFYGV